MAATIAAPVERPTLEGLDVPRHDRRTVARTPKPRLYALDGLRLVAALAVAAYHFLAVDNTRSPWGQAGKTIFPSADLLAHYGWLGVEIFFMISGFVICMSTWGRTVGDFFRSRVTRLYPAYWFCACVTALALVITPAVFDAPSFTDWLVNMTMLQDAVGTPRLDPSYWTLWAEMRFYLLFALVVWMGLTYKRVLVFGLGWTIVAAIAKTAEWKLLDIVAMPKYAPYFLVGVGLYLVHRFGHHLLTWLLIGTNLAFCLDQAVARMEYQVANVQHQALSPWLVCAVVLLGFAYILATARGRMSWLNRPWLVAAGALTYPFYLLHQQVGFSLIHHLYERAGLSAYLVLPLTFGVLLGAAWVVHRLVERPGARLLKRHLVLPDPLNAPATTVPAHR
jgi:peptidoglycan/LPS O-acetylase OafA/YrhL